MGTTKAKKAKATPKKVAVGDLVLYSKGEVLGRLDKLEDWLASEFGGLVKAVREKLANEIKADMTADLKVTRELLAGALEREGKHIARVVELESTNRKLGTELAQRVADLADLKEKLEEAITADAENAGTGRSTT